MATKAKSTSKARAAKATSDKSRIVAKKPVRATTAKRETKIEEVAVTPQTIKQQKTYQISNEPDLAPALLAEMIGTFILVAAVTATKGEPFFIGLTLIMIVAAIFSVSGAHVNPAVSFGLWSMRKLKASRMLMYWIAQFVGATLAFLMTNAFAETSTKLSFASFLTIDWKVFAVEAIGMTIFMFGIAAAARRAQTDSAKAVAIGLSLMAGLIVATGFLSQAVSANNEKDAKQENHIAKVTGVALNPAIALTLTEKSGNINPMTGEATKTDKAPVTRLGLETILGSLAGAAIGGNLYWLISRSRRDEV